jgi:hypothetical protein
MRTMLLYPTSEISDDVPVEQIRLPWNIRRTLAGAGAKNRRRRAESSKWNFA